MSVKKDYTGGIIELFRFNSNSEKWNKIGTVIEKEGGIPDKPAIAISNDGTALVGFLDIKKQGYKLLSELKIMQISTSGKIIRTINFNPEVDEAATGKVISGHQGMDIQFDSATIVS